ncbi:MAG: hypothetical protein QXG01_01635 [Candidatus Bathyarchaeia archaeon]
MKVRNEPPVSGDEMLESFYVIKDESGRNAIKLASEFGLGNPLKSVCQNDTILVSDWRIPPIEYS